MIPKVIPFELLVYPENIYQFKLNHKKNKVNDFEHISHTVF